MIVFGYVLMAKHQRYSMVFKGFSIYLSCIIFRHPCIQMVLDIWNGLYGQVTTVIYPKILFCL